MALMVECPACKGAKCDQCNQQGWIVQHDLVLRDVRMSVDPDNVTDSGQRVVTPPPCPACEAAARERDAAKAETVDARKRYRTIRDKADSLNALCENQATILSRVAVVLRGPEPQQARWSHHDLPERAAEAVAQRDAAYEDARQMQERLQRLIDAEHICEQCGGGIPIEHPCRCSVCWNNMVGELADLRAQRLLSLLAEKEAK